MPRKLDVIEDWDMVLEHEGLIVYIGLKYLEYSNLNVQLKQELRDAIPSYGYEPVARALQDFKPSKGSFSSLAGRYLWNELGDLARGLLVQRGQVVRSHRSTSEVPPTKEMFSVDAMSERYPGEDTEVSLPDLSVDVEGEVLDKLYREDKVRVYHSVLENMPEPHKALFMEYLRVGTVKAFASGKQKMLAEARTYIRFQMKARGFEGSS